MSDDLRAQTLAYAARYTQIAHGLLATGVIGLREIAELIQCRIAVDMAIKFGVAPADCLPREFVAQVDAAIARAPIGEPVKSGERAWN